VSWLGYQTRGVESQVSAISGEYTNTIQLKAKLGVLQQRSQLKYAALECWKLVAQELPAAVTLQRMSFAEGKNLLLNGQVDAADTAKLDDFYKALQNARLHDQPAFGVLEPLSYHQVANTVTWNFTLELLNAEADPK